MLNSITTTQAEILRALKINSGTTRTELLEVLGASIGTINTAIRSLEGILFEKAYASYPGRPLTITLTEKGKVMKTALEVIDAM